MNQEELIAYQTLCSIQANLLIVEIALSNKTISRDTATKHIKQALILTDRLEKHTIAAPTVHEIKELSKLLLEKCNVAYSSLGMNR